MTWETPENWFNYLNLEFKFTLDPCCVAETAKCKNYFTPDDDGLAKSWEDERVFMNPPYGREIPKWMKKAHDEARDNGALVVCFVPALVDGIKKEHRDKSWAGQVPCPCEGCGGALSTGIAGCNGHAGVRCSGGDCVNYQE